MKIWTPFEEVVSYHSFSGGRKDMKYSETNCSHDTDQPDRIHPKAPDR